MRTKVTAIFHGILSQWMGEERVEFELGEDARFADLLSALCNAYRQRTPDQLWNKEQNAFARPVIAFSEEKEIKDPEAPLFDGQEVKFFLMLAGG